jgi:hypothetical protein
MAEAGKAGVLHVDFWASAKQPDWAFGPEWWSAIRKWKAAAPPGDDEFSVGLKSDDVSHHGPGCPGVVK